MAFTFRSTFRRKLDWLKNSLGTLFYANESTTPDEPIGRIVSVSPDDAGVRIGIVLSKYGEKWLDSQPQVVKSFNIQVRSTDAPR